MHIPGFSNTSKHEKYWKERKIDWEQAYLSTWDHPHRELLLRVLKGFYWYSLWEVGVGAGANLAKIVRGLGRGCQLGGSDVSEDAIAVARKAFAGGLFHVESGENLLMSDKSVDVVLSDMALIYVGPFKIKKYLAEMKRICRNRVVLCEFYNPSWWKRWTLRHYFAHNFPKLLRDAGFYDITIEKVPEQAWPGGNPQKEYAYIITARV